MEKDELTLSMSDYQYMPLRDVVFHTLRDAILHGDLKPGERLMEIKLANRLGVSRTPIREAIRMLELEGLVIMVPRKGAQVAQITEKDLKDVLEVRMGLEELAVKFACERITESQLSELKRAAAEFARAVQEAKDEDITHLAEKDVRFHELIYKATDNQRLIQLINNLREQMYRYRIEYLKDAEIRDSLVEEHNAICQALKERDFDSACQKTVEHISRQQNTIIQMMQQSE
ncbi:MAG: GntR family transcriptional regulator [Lachnospiraceae bacterium]|nr:GntR family transcriptional regulator [Lachnospiraceae bacterium]